MFHQIKFCVYYATQAAVSKFSIHFLVHGEAQVGPLRPLLGVKI